MERKKVFVGLSGGVDSSVAAVRLLERGYDVVGVFIKVWQPDFIRCNWEAERLDAMRVAAHLGIPFLTMDAEAAYKTHVAEYMIDAYRRGVTPNPDVMCNEHVKFGAFFTWARAHGADLIATGHYAQHVVHDGTHLLTTARDTSKDQSYFLARIDPHTLPYLLFPIGDTHKGAVREEAARAGLPTSKKADSQGLCFLGPVDMHEFLGHYITLCDGDVLDTQGSVIGTHRGALLYTIGQRHGFLTTVRGGDTRPHYVVARDLERNTITVDTTPLTLAPSAQITVSDVVTWYTPTPPTVDLVLRYHGPRIQASYAPKGDGGAILTIMSDDAHTPSPGQLAVWYAGDTCLGSGIIR